MQNEYLALVRTNRNYRLLWSGAIASFLGDWFNTIALYVIVQRLTGSPLALGAVFITKMLPFAIASPLAGLLVDRFNRRRLMIVTDLLRALTVVGFLLVEGDRVSRKSTAALRMARLLSGAWPLLSLLLVVPRPLRDWAYDRFAERRYRWFGRSDACLVPTPEIRERFLA